MKITKKKLQEIVRKCTKQVLCEEMHSKQNRKKCLNEGPGSGYDLTIEGLEFAQVKITNRIDGESVDFIAKIKRCYVDFLAEGYDWSVSSENEGQAEITGGYIRGVINADYNERDIAWLLSEAKIKTMIGGGYSHVPLEETIELNDIDITLDRTEDSGYIDEGEIISADLAQIVNNAFDTRYDDDEDDMY